MNSDFVLIMKMKRGDEAALERFVRLPLHGKNPELSVYDRRKSLPGLL